MSKDQVYYLYNSMKKLNSVVSKNYTVYSLFQFSYLHAFYKANNITTKLSLKLNLIFKVSQTKRQIYIPLWTHMVHKE